MPKTYPFEVRMRYVVLRGEGHSPEQCAEALGIHPNTARHWEKHYHKLIASARRTFERQLIREYALSRAQRIKRLRGLHDRLESCLEEKEFGELPVATAVRLYLQTHKALMDECTLSGPKRNEHIVDEAFDVFDLEGDSLEYSELEEVCNPAVALRNNGELPQEAVELFKKITGHDPSFEPVTSYLDSPIVREMLDEARKLAHSMAEESEEGETEKEDNNKTVKMMTPFQKK